MPKEIVMTLSNDCACTESGECICIKEAVNTEGGVVYDSECSCACQCVECETEYYAAATDACACGGNCGCSPSA